MSFSYGNMMSPGRRDRLLRPYRPLRVSWQWLVGVLALAAIGGDVAWRVLAYAGLAVPYGTTDALILAVFLAYRVAVAVQGPPDPLPPNLMPPTSETPDRPFVGARRWEDRLAWTHDDAVSFDRTVRPRLASIVDERLRYLYGVGLAGDGPGGVERVRELLGGGGGVPGGDLWTFLTTETARVPRVAEVAAAVDRMERLFRE
ncbi:hypothetical protein [Actinocatenispora rupis]|uniref:Uncharacterized protein n=1 Tax=Actinocatenispora rupis TaxID=519421 RepID=A0A8J3J5A0_9ACTN|nr:hypothetical protein [Actinocatenispora rupis]GID10377.1 hypothetical protein Aru02nite_12660 [Actinocatenispora rupis]